MPPPSAIEWNKPASPMQELSPMQLFECFIDAEVIDMIVEYTNRYALQGNLDIEVSSREIKSDTHNDMVTKAMSRDRFSQIMKVLHFCDNTDLDKSDRYAKLRPLFSLLNTKFLEFAPLEHR
ncbi:unnamed protein product [Acanthoscelides obtectus]|uniref:PiggyBac transposable element-derived protein domain-containing protein n=1 Tax=Acanthoscelides obtectus TaxID=200917 RepID=A0A9P0Q801_ACAOB|nr:unnamed protein product [Acanthoscelides obtectus]CAK1622374.1 PiggyBac transposable element-derived protein 2 [Acanthoscelides obtectus]